MVSLSPAQLAAGAMAVGAPPAAARAAVAEAVAAAAAAEAADARAKLLWKWGEPPTHWLYERSGEELPGDGGRSEEKLKKKV